MNEIGIFAKTFARADVSAVLAAVRDTGLSLVQFNMACAGLPSLPDHVDDAHRYAIRSALAQTGVRVAGLSATFNMIHPDRQERQRGLARLRVLADCCRPLGTRLLTLCTGSRHPTDMWTAHPRNGQPDAWRDFRATLDDALRIADDYDLLLGIEPEPANVVSDTNRAQRLLREVASPRLTIVFDPANLFAQEPEPAIRERLTRGLDQLGDRLSLVHAKDRDAAGQVVAAGRGRLPYPFFVAELQRIGYTGPLILHGLPETDVAGSVAFLRTLLPQTT